MGDTVSGLKSALIRNPQSATYNPKEYLSTWNPTDFAEGRLEKKYGQHVIGRKEFGDITKEEYHHRALKHMNRNDVEIIVTKTGYVLKYDPSTNEFGSAKPDGTIETYYLPKSTNVYWETQIKKYGRDRLIR